MKTKFVMKKFFIAFALVVLIVGVTFAIFRIMSTPNTVRLFNAPITGEAQLRIVKRIKQEGVEVSVDDEGYISVADEATAEKMRLILFEEDLVPLNIDPFRIFDRAKTDKPKFVLII